MHGGRRIPHGPPTRGFGNLAGTADRQPSPGWRGSLAWPPGAPGTSLAAVLAPDPVGLNLDRFVQGIGSGLLNPQVPGMIRQCVRGPERGRAHGAVGTTVGFSVAIGPPPGGMLIALLGPGGLAVFAGRALWERVYAARGHAPMVDLALFGIGSFTFGTLIAGPYFVSSILVIELHAGGHLGPWWLRGTLAFGGIAQGAIIAPNQALTMLEVPAGNSGGAGGVMQAPQRIGTAVVIAMRTAIFFATPSATAWDTTMGVGPALIAAVVPVTLLVALADQRRRTPGMAGGIRRPGG